ncbi:MAG: NAD-dependent epimerase/dehydratase family protein [Candidatus Aminicenantes bacterium]|nr:NAD-dependent epimerase/dehydratase family protein [Candidatus Aminicenantes bacterium]
MKKKEKVLVTGAGGFIGSHLTKCLLKKGYEVICLIKPGEDLRRIKDCTAARIYGDLTEKDTLFPAVKGVSYIYHLAALLGGGVNSTDIYKVNYEGSKNLIEACLESNLKLKRFLFVSSVAAVGDTGDSAVFDEESPANPASDYGKSKLMIENHLQELGERIPHTIVRLPLVYGPGSVGGLYTVFKLARKRLQLRVGKSDTCVGFVEDIVKGMRLAAESPTAVGQKYFLGEERVYSSVEIMNHVSRALGKRTLNLRIPYFLVYMIASFAEEFARMRGKYPIIMKHSVSAYLNSNWRFSTKKAREDLGGYIEHPLPEGLKITADWYRKNGVI